MELNIISTGRCYFYDVGMGESREAKVYREQHPEVDFDRCLNSCGGVRDIRTCDNYTIRASLVPHDEEALDRIVAMDGIENGGSWE